MTTDLLMEKIFISKVSLLIITILHLHHALCDCSFCHFLKANVRIFTLEATRL